MAETTDTEDLMERWILTFLEAPAVLDPELMAAILEAHETEAPAPD